MADLVTSVAIQATDSATAVFEQATEASKSFTEAVRNQADDFRRIRSEQEAVEKSWIDAIQENVARVKAAEEEKAKAIEDAARKAEEAEKAFGENIASAIENPLHAAAEGVKGFVNAVGPMGLAAMAGAAALVEMGHAAFELVNEEGAAARQTENLAERLGTTYEETKRLSDMAKLADIDIGGLARVTLRLADALEHPSTSGKKVADALKNIGVESREAGPALLEMLEKLAQITDVTERMSAAREIMRHQAVLLQPLIANYERFSDVIERLGGQLDPAMTADLLKAREESNALGVAWDHLKEKFAAFVAPAVTPVVEGLANMLSQRGAEQLEDRIKRVKKQRDDLLESKKEGGTFQAGTDEAIAALNKQIEQLEVQKNLVVRNQEHDKDIQKGYEASADRWKEAHAKTVEGIKAALADAEKTIKEGPENILKSIRSGDTEKTAEAQKKYNEALADEVRLKAQLAAAGTDPAKVDEARINAELAHERTLLEEKRKGIETMERLSKGGAATHLADVLAINRQELEAARSAIEQKATLELKKPSGERDVTLGAQRQAAEDKYAAANRAAVEKVILEQHHLEEEQKASSNRTFEQQQRDLKKHEEEVKKSVNEMVKEGKKIEEAEARADVITESTAIAHAKRMADIERDRVETELAEGDIGAGQKIKQLKAIEDAELEAALNAENAKMRGTLGEAGDDPGKRAVAMANAASAVEAIWDAHDNKMVKLDEDAAKRSAESWNRAFSAINSGVDEMVIKMTEGSGNLERSLEQSFTKMEQKALVSLTNMGLKWAEHELKKLITHQMTQAQIDALDEASGLKKVLLYTKDFALWIANETKKLFTHSTVAAETAAVDTAAATTKIATDQVAKADNVSVATSSMGTAAAEAAAEAAPAGPEAAIAAGAAIAAALSPYVAMAAAAKGADLPSGGPFPMLLHSKEMVLPAPLAESVRNMTENTNSKAETHQHLHVTIGKDADPASVRDTIQTLKEAHAAGKLRFLFAH